MMSSGKTVDSLKNACLYEVSKKFTEFRDELKYLPKSIKTEMLKLATRRDRVLNDIVILKNLLHPDVEELILTECDVDDETLKAISICGKLKKLDLGPENDKVTTKALLQLFPKLPLLVYLVVKCTSLTDKVIEVLLQHCSGLIHLDLSYTSITNASMTNVGKFKLISLNIVKTNICDEGIKWLLEGVCCESLKEMNVNKCPIAIESIALVYNKCKNLDILNARALSHFVFRIISQNPPSSIMELLEEYHD